MTDWISWLQYSDRDDLCNTQSFWNENQQSGFDMHFGQL